MSSLTLTFNSVLLAFLCSGIFVSPATSIGADQSSKKPDSKQRKFYIQPQLDSPLLVRDLSAAIHQEKQNESKTQTIIDITFNIENRSEKIVSKYFWEHIPEDIIDCQCGGFDGREFLPGESRLQKLTFIDDGDGKSIIFRITSVEFEDGKEWESASFEPKKWKTQAKQVVPVTPKIEKSVDKKSKESATKRVLAKQWWTSPVISDQIIKTLNGKQLVIEEITVQTKLHQLKREILDLVESCYIEQNNEQITYNTLDFAVDKFTTYEVKDRVFAYEIPYELINAEDGQHEIGAGNRVIFVDEEGNGNFKLLCNENEELESLPKWVKSLYNK